MRGTRRNQEEEPSQAIIREQTASKLGDDGNRGSQFYSTPAAAQLSPTTKKAESVKITQGPEIERADSYLTIVRWDNQQPWGSPSITEWCTTVRIPTTLARQQNLQSG